MTRSQLPQNPVGAIPIWFWIIAGFGLVWNIMGVWAFFYEINISPEAILALPENQQSFYENKPFWTNIPFAISVFTGFLGCILLCLRKKLAVQIFIFSLISILAHNLYSFFISGFYQVALPSQYIMPITVIIIAFFLIWFSRFSHHKGWLK